MKRRRKFQPKFFVILDIHGREWTTKTGLKILRGIYAVDFKKYFYELKFYERVRKMKCLIHSAGKWKSAEKVLEKYPYFKNCDYIKQGKIKEYFLSDPVEKRRAYKQLYIEGDANFIFEKLKEISDTIKNDEFILTFRDDGNIEAMIYDAYVE